MQTINERLAALPRILKYDSPAALAKACGIDPNTLRKAMQGPSKPSFDVLEALTKKHPKLSSDWLLLGKGEPIKGAESTSAAPSPETEKPTEGEAKPARPDTVRHADTVLKLASVEAENQQLRERLEDAKEEILWLRGKSRTSPDAAGPQNLAPLPAPNEIGYHACAQRRAAEFDEYVAVRQEEGGVAELV